MLIWVYPTPPDDSSGEDTDAQDFDYDSSTSKSSEVREGGGGRKGRDKGVGRRKEGHR